MSEVEFLKIQTCALKVNMHCEGCKQKVKKILQKIDGVYIIKLEAEMGKVTVVSGDVEAETLIRTLNKHGKHAELIGDPSKQNNGVEVEDGNGAKRKKGGGQKCNNIHLPPPPAMAMLNNPQRMKALQDLMTTKLPPRYNVPVNGDDGAQVPIPKSVKVDLPTESDDVSGGDDTEDNDFIEDYEEESGMEAVPSVYKTTQPAAPPSMVGGVTGPVHQNHNGQGGGAGISMTNDRARAAHVTMPNRMAVNAAPGPGGNVGPTGGMRMPIPQRGTQVGHTPNFQIPTAQDIPATAVHVGGAAVANSYPQQAMYFRPPPAVSYFPPSALYPSFYPNPPPQDNYYSGDEDTTGCTVM